MTVTLCANTVSLVQSVCFTSQRQHIQKFIEYRSYSTRDLTTTRALHVLTVYLLKILKLEVQLSLV